MDQQQDQESCTTAPEIVAAEEELEEEAQEVEEEDWGDERSCTYSRGYYEQPVYSCKTCANKNGGKYVPSTRISSDKSLV